MARRIVNTPDPSVASSDWEAMSSYWDKVEAILGGAESMRENGTTYLPQFPLESDDDYEHRRETAPFTNIFADIVENLASKPFSKEVGIADDAPQNIKDLIEDIDGRGNHLHVFAANMFYNGVAKAIDWILVDYPKVPKGLTQAGEKALGAKPYWVHVPAERVIAVYSAIINGKEEFVHVRISETRVERVGFEEVEVELIRVFDRPRVVTVDEETGVESESWGEPTFTLYRKEVIVVRGREKINWVIEDQGPISIGVIPMVPFVCGRRKEGTWRVKPPMQDAADMQIEHFQQETNLKSIKEKTCFPMLAGNGITPPLDSDGNPQSVPAGPFAVLFAPPNRDGENGTWDILEPSANSLTFLANDLKALESRLRELGRQPLTAESGNLTVVTTQFAAQKGNSAVQAWALLLKDALERAFEFTALWMNDDAAAVEVKIHTDFGIESLDGSSMEQVISMRKNGDLPLETLWSEAQRRGVLSAEFDPEEAKDQLAEEAPEDPDAEDIEASLVPQPPGNNNNPPPKKEAA